MRKYIEKPSWINENKLLDWFIDETIPGSSRMKIKVEEVRYLVSDNRRIHAIIYYYYLPKGYYSDTYDYWVNEEILKDIFRLELREEKLNQLV